MEQATERDRILSAMAGFIAQRSGIDARDYFETWRDSEGVKAWKADKREHGRDGREARAMLAFIRGREGIDAAALKSAMQSAFSGRLTWDGEALDYTPGQNGATEYRAAACAVLAQAIRVYWRGDGNDWRKLARDYFGRGAASRCFN
jgi:hypothetical protein